MRAAAHGAVGRGRLRPDAVKRIAVYSSGGADALLLDRVDPGWRDRYLQTLFDLAPLFVTGR